MTSDVNMGSELGTWTRLGGGLWCQNGGIMGSLLQIAGTRGEWAWGISCHGRGVIETGEAKSKIEAMRSAIAAAKTTGWRK